MTTRNAGAQAPDAHKDTRPVAVVTGAGGGVGRAVSLQLAQRGWRIVLAGRTDKTLRETAELACERADAAGDLADIALVVPTDMADTQQARALIEATVQAFGRIDALINNAAVADFTPIEHTTDEVLERAFRVNAIGPAAAIAGAWRHMLRQKRGRIVNVSTISTLDPFPGLFAYSASKAACNAMALCCRNEGQERGVLGFSVAPGAIETPMLRAFVPEAQLPKKMTLTPDVVASVVVECAVGERDRDNGKTIIIPSPGAETPSASTLITSQESDT